MVAEVCKRPLNPPVTAYGGEAQSLHEAGRDGAQTRWRAIESFGAGPARTGWLRSAVFGSLIPRGKQMRNWLEMNPSTLVLARSELASLRLRGRACRISCVTGRLWVTASGRREESVLAPREEVTFTGRGRIVVEALRTTKVRLEIHTAERVKARALFPLGRLPGRLGPPPARLPDRPGCRSRRGGRFERQRLPTRLPDEFCRPPEVPVARGSPCAPKSSTRARVNRRAEVEEGAGPLIP